MIYIIYEIFTECIFKLVKRRVYHNNLYLPVGSTHQNIEHIALGELDKFPFPWLGVVPIFDLIVPKNQTSQNMNKCVLII